MDNDYSAWDIPGLTIPSNGNASAGNVTCLIGDQVVTVPVSSFTGSINGTVPSRCTYHNVNDSIYGYTPDLAANVVGAVLFFLILAFQLLFGLFTRDWWFFVTWGITAGLELTAYIGRSISNKYITSVPMFQMQLVCTIIAPAFEAAGLYYILGKQVTLFGEQYSPLPPMIYTAIFTSADVISLVVQGVGGGVAAANVDTPKGPEIGQWVMVAGIAFQVLILSVFIVFWSIVNWRIYHDDPNNWDPKFAANRARPLFKFLFAAACLSMLFLEIRSIYRIVELATGWDGHVFKTERYFLILDGLMIVLSMIPLTIIYPGLAYGYVPVRGLDYKLKKPKYPEEEIVDVLPDAETYSTPTSEEKLTPDHPPPHS